MVGCETADARQGFPAVVRIESAPLEHENPPGVAGDDEEAMIGADAGERGQSAADRLADRQSSELFTGDDVEVDNGAQGILQGNEKLIADERRLTEYRVGERLPPDRFAGAGAKRGERWLAIEVGRQQDPIDGAVGEDNPQR